MIQYDHLAVRILLFLKSSRRMWRSGLLSVLLFCRAEEVSGALEVLCFSWRVVWVSHQASGLVLGSCCVWGNLLVQRAQAHLLRKTLQDVMKPTCSISRDWSLLSICVLKHLLLWTWVESVDLSWVCTWAESADLSGVCGPELNLALWFSSWFTFWLCCVQFRSYPDPFPSTTSLQSVIPNQVPVSAVEALHTGGSEGDAKLWDVLASLGELGLDLSRVCGHELGLYLSRVCGPGLSLWTWIESVDLGWVCAHELSLWTWAESGPECSLNMSRI